MATVDPFLDRSPVAVAASESPNEIDLVAYALLLVRHLRVIVGFGFLALVLMLLFLLVTKPRYAATAVMILPQGNDKASALEAQVSASTSDLLGGGFELYSDIMLSRSVADGLIQRFDLMQEYHSPDIQAAENTLAAVTKVEIQREGVLRITVQDGNPQRAADLANAYVEQLNVLNEKLVLTSVGQRRAFLEREMIKEKDRLADAEVALKRLQEGTSGLSPDAQAGAALSAIETTRAQLRAAQIHLESLLTGETEANPEVVRARREVEGLSQQLVDLQHGESSSAETGTPTSQVPEEALQYTRLAREVKFHETLFSLLEGEFEQAKLEESKTPNIVQVLDPAVRPLHKAWPPRTFYCLVSIVGGLLFGVIAVSLWAFIGAYVHAPQNAAQIEDIKTIFRQAILFRN